MNNETDTVPGVQTEQERRNIAVAESQVKQAAQKAAHRVAALKASEDAKKAKAELKVKLEADRKASVEAARVAAAQLAQQKAETKAVAPKLSSVITESRKSLLEVLPTGQSFFESPEGHIVVAESDVDQVWCHHSAKGQGAWINKRR